MPKAKLTQIGFTDLESDIYMALLRKGAATGYAVAKELSKPVANVYKALESLADKGAVAQAQSEKKLFKPTPWRQLLNEEKRRHQRTLKDLEVALEAVPEPGEDEEVYQLKNADQVFAAGIEIISGAKTVLLADLEPGVVPLFSEALVKAAKRGVDVRVKVYQPTELAGVKVTWRRQGEEIYARTGNVRFKISADGSAFLNALLNDLLYSVIQAFTSQSALMNMSIHNGLVYELVLTELKPLIAAGDLEAAQAVLAETAHLHPFTSKNSVLDVYTARYSTPSGETK